MLNKDQKVKFVNEGKKELSKYSVIGVLPLANIPDRLVQKSRNTMRSKVRFILGRRTLLVKILESDAKTKHLTKELKGTSAILLSNDDPFAIYKEFKSNSIKLAAKPHQISPDDIEIQAAETTLQPGQTVTELKQAGIDVQIQKGKVVIAKDKVLVKKGAKITPAVSKALKILDIMPFTASITPSVLMQGQLMFTRDILGIDSAVVLKQVTTGFNAALQISLKANIISRYTIRIFIERAYREAIAVGVEGHIPEPGIIEKLMTNAVMGASQLNSMVKPAPAEAAAAPPAQ